MIQGVPVFDGLAVGEFTVDRMNGTGTTIVAKGAFINTRTGSTHGFCVHKGPWSEATIARLQELLVSMEVDIGRTHLENGGSLSIATPAAGPPPGDEGGLGNHLGGDQV